MATATFKAQTKTTEKTKANKMVQLDKILVATDFSPASMRALDYALALARRYESYLHVAHVISADAYPMVAPEVAVDSVNRQHREAEEKFRELEFAEKFGSVKHEAHIEEGALWPAIEGLVDAYGIDLVVVGTRGVGRVQKVIIGSGAEQIFRQSKQPVLTIGPAVENGAASEPAFQNILFATDFGLGAEREAAYAFSLGQENNARVTLLHVMRHLEDYSEDGITLKKEAIRTELQELVPQGGDFWCHVDLRMEVGDPGELSLAVAAEMHADLIVMGAKKRSGLAGHVPGTLAYKIVTDARCPVLTIRS